MNKQKKKKRNENSRIVVCAKFNYISHMMFKMFVQNVFSETFIYTFVVAIVHDLTYKREKQTNQKKNDCRVLLFMERVIQQQMNTCAAFAELCLFIDHQSLYSFVILWRAFALVPHNSFRILTTITTTTKYAFRQTTAAIGSLPTRLSLIISFTHCLFLSHFFFDLQSVAKESLDCLSI